MEFKSYLLKDLCSIKHGYAFSGKGISKEKTNNILITPGNFLIGGGFKADKYKYFSETLKFPEEYILSPNDLVVTMTDLSVASDTLGYAALVPSDMMSNYLHNQRIGLVHNINRNLSSKEFLYWLMRTKYYHDCVVASQSGTAIHHTSPERILNIKINLPSLENQNKIVLILSTIDKQIEINNKINDNLQKLSQELYENWFVDFEFPDENGKPYKSSGGKMIESELGEIPYGWEVRELKNFFPVLTGKKDANASSSNGLYPFFTCSQSISKIDSYSFDAEAILLSGNGDFNVKFFRGKFDAYQRTYVLVPKDEKLLGYLYQSIVYNLDNITSGHRGSVIKFITKGSIEDFKIPFKGDLEIFLILKQLLLNIESRNKENESLIELRSALLPKLMNGEIDLDKIDL